MGQVSHHDRQHARRNVRCVLCTPHRHGNADWDRKHGDRKRLLASCSHQVTRTRRRKGPKHQEYIDLEGQRCPNPVHAGTGWRSWAWLQAGSRWPGVASGRTDIVHCRKCGITMPRILKAREG